MKRISALLLALVMMLTVVPAMADEVTGTAKGFGGDVTVTLTVEDGVITAAKATGDAETPGVGTPALEQLPALMAQYNTVNVDVLSGATFTSNGVIDAAKAALTSAGLNVEDYMAEIKAEVAEDAVLEADIVIVGAGGAGMTSALTAAEKGAKVVILESQAAVGGNSVRATGGMNAGDTPYQDNAEFGQSAGVEKTLASVETTYADNAVINQLADEVEVQWAAYQQNAEGYFDSVELMQLDTLIGGKNLNDPALVKVLADIKPADDDELAGVNIIRRAIEEPLRQIAHNAGFEGSIVVEKVRGGKDGFGFNAATGEYEDLIKAGVIDPKKVTRTALQNAASVASLLLTTECAIAEKPEPKKDAPAMPGGMGGMGGMDGMY